MMAGGKQEVRVIDRRSFIAGALAGASGVGVLGGGVSVLRRPPKTAAEPQPAEPKKPEPQFQGCVSYSQMGEDIVLFHLLRFGMKIDKPTYLDIGAADPIEGSNTYLLHWNGGHGVLVEPNPAFQARLRVHRPNDVVVNAGVGVSDAQEADYYIIRNAPPLNTFSPDDVAILRARAHEDVVERVIKMPLISINRLIAEHLGASPDLLSIDVEGMDFAILRTLDFKKYRPAVVIAETLPRGPIPKLLASKGYEIRGASMYNTIFADPKRYA
jgi:FkbM family methyltransferase